MSAFDFLNWGVFDCYKCNSSRTVWDQPISPLIQVRAVASIGLSAYFRIRLPMYLNFNSSLTSKMKNFRLGSVRLLRVLKMQYLRISVGATLKTKVYQSLALCQNSSINVHSTYKWYSVSTSPRQYEHAVELPFFSCTYSSLYLLSSWLTQMILHSSYFTLLLHCNRE